MARLSAKNRRKSDKVAREELIHAERRSQRQICLVMATTISVSLVIAYFLLEDHHLNAVMWFGLGMVVIFFALAELVRQGRYHPAFKFVNATLQVTMVSAVIIIDSILEGPVYALSSMPIVFYALVVATAALSFSPGLCLFVGLFAAAQLLGLYFFHLRPSMAPDAIDLNPAVGFVVTTMKAVILASTGVASSLVARKARALIAEVSRTVRTEEKLAAVEAELELAGDVQSRLVEEFGEDIEGLAVEREYRPSRQVGGDYVAVMEYAGRAVAVVADVSGKGYPAALTMAGVQAMLRVLVEEGVTPHEGVRRLNDALCRNLTAGRFVTLAWLDLDPATGHLAYVNCGHVAPLLVAADGECIGLTEGGPPLGVLESVEWDTGEVQVEVGGTVLLQTDGVTEARRGRGFPQLGDAPVTRLVSEAAGEELGEIRQRLLKLVRRHLGGAAPSDDLTFCLIRRLAIEE